MFRDSASISAIVCSAVLSVLPAGVFITTMPQRVAAVLSMLSVPTPARTIALSRRLPSSDVGRDLHAAAADRAVELGERLAQRVALESGADFVFNARRGLEHVEAFLSERVENNHAGHGGRSQGSEFGVREVSSRRRPRRIDSSVTCSLPQTRP